MPVNLLVRVWGIGADSRPFFQNGHAGDISTQGAKLSGIERQLTTGDVIGVQLGNKKARFRVVWVNDAGPLQKIQAGVQMLEGQQCPWEQELTQAEKIAEPVAQNPPVAQATPAAQTTRSAQNRRRLERHKVSFPIELRDERGSGCYVETLLPLPRDTELSITFWMESEKISTRAIVRACDGGVGMGIEFTGLNNETQERLQRLIEKMDDLSHG